MFSKKHWFLSAGLIAEQFVILQNVLLVLSHVRSRSGAGLTSPQYEN